MWQSIKNFFSSNYSKLVLGLGAVITVLLYVLNLKNGKLNDLQAQIALTATTQDADALEATIKQDLAQANLSEQEIDTLNQALALLEKKRQELAKNSQSMPPNQVQDFWNKN